MIRNKNTRNIIIWIFGLVVILGIVNVFQGSIVKSEVNLIFSDFLDKVNSKKITKVEIKGNEIFGELNSDDTAIGKVKFKTYMHFYPNLIKELKDSNVAIEVLPPNSKLGSFIGVILSLAPMIILLIFWGIVTRQMQNTGGKALGFGNSQAKMLSAKNSKITFNDIAGIEEAKEELVELVDFLRDPLKFKKLGGVIPKGCLLIGPPGTGKTLLAKAIAGEANVPFFSISGSDFVEMFVGVGASRVRSMFAQAKKNTPCIIFIDEIDAVGRSRGGSMGAGHEEREQTLNQLLVEMDGFNSNEGVIVIAATNRPDVLDNALLRPGRFDRQVVVSSPDINGREKILKVHLRKVKYSSDLDIRLIARGTPGFTGADLSNLVNESALLAAKKEKNHITLSDVEESKDKVMMGMERKSFAISDEQKKVTAYHEAGHAIVSLYVKESDPIHKATIIPRGKALGLVMRLPEIDRVMETKQKIESDITVAMGGRAAEEIIFGKEKITSGAYSDIKAATKYAKAMVMQWGMSNKVGLIFHSSDNNFYTTKSDYPISEYMSELIDKEIKKIIDTTFLDAKNILKSKIDKLHLLAKELIEKETLTGNEIKKIVMKKN